MLVQNRPKNVYELWTKHQRENRQHQEAHESPSKNGHQKMREPHFRHRRRQSEQLEGSGRRQHRRKHQAPEGMLRESLVKFIKAFRRDAFAQKSLATPISDSINYQAAQRRSRGSHEHVEQKP